MAWCDNHPDNEAVGVCMRCEARICTVCCTQLDGINHCHQCLAELGRRTTRKREPSSIASSLALIIVIWAFFWLVLYMARGVFY